MPTIDPIDIFGMFDVLTAFDVSISSHTTFWYHGLASLMMFRKNVPTVPHPS